MTLNFTDTQNPNDLYLEIQNVNLSLVNGIRRAILSEYNTIGFKTEEYLNSDLKVLENTSSIHNEYILHRIGLVPIHYESVKSFDSSKYLFILKKENTTNTIIDVTSEDFIVINTETGNEENSKDFFPPDTDTNDFILILKLKPNPNKKGEKLHIEGSASIGSGSQNARFSPVSCIAFKNKIDETKKEAGLENYLSKHLSPEESTNSKLIKSKTLEFELGYADRYFHTDKNDNPNIFEMQIESIGVTPSHLILYETLQLLKDKCYNINNIINSIITEHIESDKIKLYKSIDTMDAIEIEIQNETHTLGNIIQSYASELFDLEQLQFIGYKNPHPLKKYIIVKLKTPNNTLEEIQSIINTTLEHVIEVINSMKEQIATKFSLQPKTKLKIKKSKSKKLKLKSSE